MDFINLSPALPLMFAFLHGVLRSSRNALSLGLNTYSAVSSRSVRAPGVLKDTRTWSAWWPVYKYREHGIYIRWSHGGQSINIENMAFIAGCVMMAGL